MFPNCVSKFCFQILFPNCFQIVSKLCFQILFPNSVSKLCFQIVFPNCVSKLRFQIVFPELTVWSETGWPSDRRLNCFPVCDSWTAEHGTEGGHFLDLLIGPIGAACAIADRSKKKLWILPNGYPDWGMSWLSLSAKRIPGYDRRMGNARIAPQQHSLQPKCPPPPAHKNRHGLQRTPKCRTGLKLQTPSQPNFLTT